MYNTNQQHLTVLCCNNNNNNNTLLRYNSLIIINISTAGLMIGLRKKIEKFKHYRILLPFTEQRIKLKSR